MNEVLRTLTQLPGGLPTTLSDWHLSDLAKAVVLGVKATGEDGRPIVGIRGRWYSADRRDLVTYMQETGAPRATAPVQPQRPVQRGPAGPQRSPAVTELPDSSQQPAPGKGQKGRGVR